MIYVDSDNALGSPSGDVDDGIALAVLLSSDLPVEALASTFGNTSSRLALENHRRLGAECGYTGPCLLGVERGDDATGEAGSYLAEKSKAHTLLALGPLTNIARALSLPEPPDFTARIREVVCLGANSKTWGRWPPLWPFEFNFTKDRAALVQVFESGLPLTVVPLDQAGRLRVRFDELAPIRGPLGAYLRRHAERWFIRARRFKGQSTVPVWDLVAVAQVVWPELFRIECVDARAHANGFVEFARGGRELPRGRRVRLVRDYDPREVWRRSLELLNRAAAKTPASPADTPGTRHRSAG